MKKPLFTILILAILLTMSNCTNEAMNEPEQYLTITYHSEGHTAGEPPVDEKKYKPMKYQKIN